MDSTNDFVARFKLLQFFEYQADWLEDQTFTYFSHIGLCRTTVFIVVLVVFYYL